AATISGTATGAVTEDATPNAASGALTVSDADSGEAVFQSPASLNGAGSTFSREAATGAWADTPDNRSAAVEGRKARRHGRASLTVTSQDGTASQAIVVTITGANDAATISGTATGAVTEDATPNAASGALTVSDADSGEAVFQSPASLN